MRYQHGRKIIFHSDSPRDTRFDRTELVPDPDFDDESLWTMVGNFGDVSFSDGALRVGPGAGQNDAMFTSTAFNTVAGKTYYYEIVVPTFDGILGGTNFDIDIGGHTLYSIFDDEDTNSGTGTFTGSFVATTTATLTIIFNFTGHIVLSRLSIQE